MIIAVIISVVTTPLMKMKVIFIEDDDDYVDYDHDCVEDNYNDDDYDYIDRSAA